jgi:GNAT superfamily N-acetyltransferase
MTDLKIRKGTVNDLAALVAFNQAMAMETEGKQLVSDTLSKGVRTLLESDTRGYYLVAEKGSEIVGSLMVTYEWSDWRNSDFWWVQSVYVKPENRRQGIYSALYTQVKSLAKSTAGVCGYRLYVEKENMVAQQTYQKLDMRESHYLMYEGN